MLSMLARSSFLSTPSARRATRRPCSHAGKARFLSTPSARRATMPVLSAVPVGTNFYPRPPRGGRRIKQDGSWSSHSISIHALREEGDHDSCRCPAGRKPISIHALREEGDLLDLIGVQGHEKFLSTPSARRATALARYRKRRRQDFYPRPPRGGRPEAAGQENRPYRFLSTPSARRATQTTSKWSKSEGISIHALREEGD